MRKVALIFILVFVFAPVAYSAIEITTDHRALFFGLMQLGQEKELAEFGTYHNQITCSSTNQNAWYLKINLLSPLSSGAQIIPLEYFQWQLTYTDGVGTVANPHQYKEFSLTPDLVYISGPDEATGTSINFQFRYYLKIPEVQTSGTYNTTIRFTLMEVL